MPHARIGRAATALVLTLAAVFGVCAVSFAARAPLLQEGKKTLFQRVVTHPAATLYAGPEAAATVARAPVKTFSVFYVYGREGNRLEVGSGTTGPEGWIDAAAVTEWPQALTMVFTDRAGRMPVLFFRDRDSLVKTCEADDLGKRMKGLNEQVQSLKQGATPPADLPVIAAEPGDEKGAVSRERFYLLPVLGVDERFGEQTKLLQVASIDPGSTDAASGGAGGAGGQKDAGGKPGDDAALRTGLVFVVDTTISMRPYIDQTKAMLRAIYDELEKSPNGDKVAFAVVAFRNNLGKSPKLGYVTKVISDFATVKERKKIEQALTGLDEATASSHAFDEDAMSGVKDAVDKLSWQNYGSRAMLLVTDAGPLRGADPTSGTRLDPQEMADYVKSHSIWPTVVHVRTPAGKANHAQAEQAYRLLAKLPDNSASYVPLDAPTPAQGAKAFDRVGKALAGGYRGMVEATASGKMLAKPDDLAPAQDPEARAKQIADLTGYAMQLEFVGARDGNRAPSVVSAWIADADLERLSRNQQGAPIIAAQPAVLLTKNQLSDLAAQLKIIIEQAERTKRTDARDFFESIVSASAQLTRDPARFSHQPNQNLAQTGVLAEFLDGLPYKSDILLMREDDWYNKSTGEQTAFINRLKSKLARYEEYDKDRAGWESFGAANPGDWVYRVPLTVLP